MEDGEIIEKITSIDHQIHDLKKLVLESESLTKEDGKKDAARAWLAQAMKLEKKWPKTAPSVLEITQRDRRHNE
jgi:hypothetical protein